MVYILIEGKWYRMTKNAFVTVFMKLKSNTTMKLPLSIMRKFEEFVPTLELAERLAVMMLTEGESGVEAWNMRRVDGFHQGPLIVHDEESPQ